MRFDTAFDQLQFLPGAHRAAAVDENLPVARHRFQTAFEKFVFRFADGEFFRQRGHGQRHALVFQYFDNPFAAGQGEFVALLLACQKRVFFPKA
ncbi:hypothetical protein HMPREF9120_02727 [Neisseria sp. oral taxon 020 str. F0370]|nr:hypothetical protein HMPREF9120_02727 [Neisseria sp. oral taxon 020 str. F0370]